MRAFFSIVKVCLSRQANSHSGRSLTESDYSGLVLDGAAEVEAYAQQV
jgi:hypothetical protein